MRSARLLNPGDMLTIQILRRYSIRFTSISCHEFIQKVIELTQAILIRTVISHVDFNWLRLTIKLVVSIFSKEIGFLIQAKKAETDFLKSRLLRQ